MDITRQEWDKKVQLFLTLNREENLKALGKDLFQVDQEFRELIRQAPRNARLLFGYNEFRIAHLNELPRDRPHILIGGLFNLSYLSLHIYPLFEIADVICLTCRDEPFPYFSTLHCHPLMQFSEILNKLPSNFKPDFYWDNQVEHRHFIPAGIEAAPFPTVASICHSYFHKSVEAICELFDWICPVSKFYGNILGKKFPEKIIDLPFGLNWASFDLFVSPGWEKSIDVCLTFSESDEAFYCGHRNRVIQMLRQFKEKYGNKFSIEIVSNLPIEKYMDILFKSRIAINVTGINGPYNYRVVEAINSGTMLLQYDWKDEFFENPFGELFAEGVHGDVFNYENFESKLLHYLENKELSEKIAKEALHFLKENYTYKKLYQQLLEHVKKNPVNRTTNIQPFIGYLHSDMAYYYQCNDCLTYMNYGCFYAAYINNWIGFNNLMLLSCIYPLNTPIYQLFLSIVSVFVDRQENTDPWSICSNFYKKALEKAPQEYAWIIEWNFLLLSLEKGKAEKKEIERMLTLVDKKEVVPFEENHVIFKYYVDSPTYPKYQLHNLKKHEFIELNMNLIKVIDKPQERALLYRNYALDALHYFLRFSAQK